MIMKDKRIRINKRMMAWTDGTRTNVIPSVWRQVDDYGRTMRTYCTYRRYLRAPGRWVHEG